MKDNHTVGKEMARNDRKKAIYQYHSFLLRLYITLLSNFLNTFAESEKAKNNHFCLKVFKIAEAQEHKSKVG